MSRARDRLFAHLAELGVETTTIDHPPVFTVEEAARYTGHLPGARTKNLFLEDREGGLWLVVCRGGEREGWENPPPPLPPQPRGCVSASRSGCPRSSE